jgi:hypothetical protein
VKYSLEETTLEAPGRSTGRDSLRNRSARGGFRQKVVVAVVHSLIH